MRVKLTLTLSNDKHPKLMDELGETMLNQVLKKQYQEAFNHLVSLGDDPSEKIIVETCKVIKEG